jgi:hypothetical protein
MDAALLSDRRRANRTDYENPHLIALLRGQRAAEPRDMKAKAAPESEGKPEAQADLTGDLDQGGLTSARGVAYGLLFGAALWALIALLWYLL